MQEYQNRFLGSEIEPRKAEDCLFHIIPVPYEESVSYGGGTAKGPERILDASDQLELLMVILHLVNKVFLHIFPLIVMQIQKLLCKEFLKKHNKS